MSEPNCPFYGHAAGTPDFGTLLIPTRGNQCALVLNAHSPCYMEIMGHPPEWKKCWRIERARQLATLLEEHINNR